MKFSITVLLLLLPINSSLANELDYFMLTDNTLHIKKDTHQLYASELIELSLIQTLRTQNDPIGHDTPITTFALGTEIRTLEARTEITFQGINHKSLLVKATEFLGITPYLKAGIASIRYNIANPHINMTDKSHNRKIISILGLGIDCKISRNITFGASFEKFGEARDEDSGISFPSNTELLTLDASRYQASIIYTF